MSKQEWRKQIQRAAAVPKSKSKMKTNWQSEKDLSDIRERNLEQNKELGIRILTDVGHEWHNDRHNLAVQEHIFIAPGDLHEPLSGL